VKVQELPLDFTAKGRVNCDRKQRDEFMTKKRKQLDQKVN
jgi:hypothetical protein